MGAENSTHFHDVTLEVPTVTYEKDDNGFEKGKTGTKTLKIDSFTVSGNCSNLPKQFMLELEKKEGQLEQKKGGHKALTENSIGKEKFACPLVRLASLKTCTTQASDRITLAKAGYFYAVREMKLKCFWCNHQEDVLDGGRPFKNKNDLFHNCEYSNHMKKAAGKLSCIDLSENIDKLCKKMECPLCRWDL